MFSEFCHQTNDYPDLVSGLHPRGFWFFWIQIQQNHKALKKILGTQYCGSGLRFGDFLTWIWIR
jgi:hypothetical protein